MIVRLAGHNLDRDLLLEIRSALELAARLPVDRCPEATQAQADAEALLEKDNWTPETLSAAYARISRDPRPVTELRKTARDEVDAARRSNEKIIFGLGHASVAEHAVFNFDILGVSRLAVEEIERMRLCSYTEKSQRYILLDEDFVLPEEIRAAGLEEQFRSLIGVQSGFYRRAHDHLLPHVLDRFAEQAATPQGRRAVEGLAKEDARYGLSLATTVQLGETINARNLESLVRRTAAHPLMEIQEFSRRIYDAVAGLAPSVVKYTEPTAYLQKTPELLRQAVATGAPGTAEKLEDAAEVTLIDVAQDAEVKVVAALLHSHGRESSAVCRDRAERMGAEGRLQVVRAALRHLGPHDSVLREFEHATLHFEMVVSAACFGQLKRHRMVTLTTQEYDPGLGVTIPPLLHETGLAMEFDEVRRESETLHSEILRRGCSQAASYALLNAHRRRILWTINARELYHFARLRLDLHAQWDIRRIAEQAVDQARERVPGLLLLCCGKDRFDSVRRELFGD